MTDLYCSMIHGGLMLTLKTPQPQAQHCCLRKDGFKINLNENFWNNFAFESLRETNLKNLWDSGCSNCQRLEQSGQISMRQGMNQGLEIAPQTKLSGPARIDLMFDISCNLACRTCGPNSSTYWQKHLQENQLWTQPIFRPRSEIGRAHV